MGTRDSQQCYKVPKTLQSRWSHFNPHVKYISVWTGDLTCKDELRSDLPEVEMIELFIKLGRRRTNCLFPVLRRGMSFEWGHIVICKYWNCSYIRNGILHTNFEMFVLICGFLGAVSLRLTFPYQNVPVALSRNEHSNVMMNRTLLIIIFILTQKWKMTNKRHEFYADCRFGFFLFCNWFHIS